MAQASQGRGQCSLPSNDLGRADFAGCRQCTLHDGEISPAVTRGAPGCSALGTNSFATRTPSCPVMIRLVVQKIGRLAQRGLAIPSAAQAGPEQTGGVCCDAHMALQKKPPLALGENHIVSVRWKNDWVVWNSDWLRDGVSNNASSRGWIEEGFRPDARRCRKLFCIWRGRLPKEPDYSQRGGVGCTASWGRVEDCDRALADAKYVVVRNLRIKLSRAYKRGRACRPINLDD